jgi:hypothetical protein
MSITRRGFLKILGAGTATVVAAPLITPAAPPLELQEVSAKWQAARWLEPRVTEDWFSGVGMAYDAAPGFDTFAAPGYVLPIAAQCSFPEAGDATT